MKQRFGFRLCQASIKPSDKIKQNIQSHAQKTKSEQQNKELRKNRMPMQMHTRMLERGSCQDNYNVMSSKIRRRNLEIVTGS